MFANGEFLFHYRVAYLHENSNNVASFILSYRMIDIPFSMVLALGIFAAYRAIQVRRSRAETNSARHP